MEPFGPRHRDTCVALMVAAVLMAAGVPIQANLLRKGVGTMLPYQSFDEFFAAAKKEYPS